MILEFFLSMLFETSSANAQSEPICSGSYSTIGQALDATAHREENIVQRWIQSQQKELEKFAKFKSKVGDQLVVNDRSVRVRALLGKGASGAVYLVETPAGLRAAKVFDNEEYLKSDLAVMARFAEWGGLPKVFEYDLQTRTAIMEYVEGIPMDQILSPYANVGLAATERLHIIEVWQKTLDELEATAPWEGAVILEKNVVYSFKEKKIRMIDPN